MKKLLSIGVLACAIALSGCAGSNFNPNVATPSQEYVGLNAYDAAVKAANRYLRLPLCSTQKAVCRTQQLSKSVYVALRSARGAKETILAALDANQQLPLTAIQALEAAYAVIQQIPQN